ncbi:hypothetical protein [Halobacteriovorax sp. ZH2_bin.1]|uniref:hypothetical protein n=1 Tax=Halobacteriovorax sp. ZH2_bin.1 TaxID=3157724 RepID=UPI00372323E6
MTEELTVEVGGSIFPHGTITKENPSNPSFIESNVTIDAKLVINKDEYPNLKTELETLIKKYAL